MVTYAPDPRSIRARPNPVFLAGYLAWAAVAIGLWRAPPVWTPLGETAGRTVAALCMLAFVGGIMRRGRDGGSIISLSLMVVSALVLLARRRGILGNTTGVDSGATAEYDEDTGQPVRSK